MSSLTCLSLDQPLISYLGEKLQNSQLSDPKEYLKTTVILPTRRAVKELKKNILSRHSNSTVLLPKIMAINDLENQNSGAILSETKRKGLVLKTLEKIEGDNSPNVGQLLLSLLDDMNTHEANPEKLSEIVPEVYADHWQLTSSFLKDFLREWQEILKKEKALEHSAHMVSVLKNTADFWSTNPPQFPVILAGLDGFIPAVNNLMVCVQNLPKGQVILNGYLPSLEGETYPETHPNYLLNSFIRPQDFLPNARAHLITQMMSDRAFEERDTSQVSFEGVTLLESPTLDQEAQSIAILARQNLEHPTKITAIITPDQALAEKIQQALSRWHIRVDSAGGTPLSQAPLGRFILDTLNLQAPQQDATPFLSVLKSPFAILGYDSPYDLKKQVRCFEERVLRADPNRVVDLDDSLTDFMDRFDQATSAFFTLKTNPQNTLMDWLQGHITLLEHLNPLLWDSDAGKTAALCFKDLLKNASSYPEMPLKDYQDIVKFSLSQQTLREAVNHPRLKMLSPIQGAYTSYDCAILCGLNEGIWPQNSSINPWLNRDMSLALGLPDAQVLIGRAAALLTQNMTCPDVVLSYAQRRGTEPASPSRWVLRLKALGQKMNEEQAILLDMPLAKWADILDQPEQKIALQAPLSFPELAVRPKRFSISDVERLFKDPYQIYAKHILKLNPLRALNEPFGPADFGTWVHKILEQSILQNKPIEDLAKVYLPKKLPPDTAFLWLKSFGEMEGWAQHYLLDQREKSLETFVEKNFTTSFDSQGTTYELVGKADRIDRLMDGTYEIIDYKTGSTPSKKALEAGDAPQLPLLAYLFEKNTPHAHVSTLTYVNLNTQKVHHFKRENLVEDTVERFITTLEHYHQTQHAYEVNPYESLQDRFNPYQHLERTPEWLEHGGSDV